MVSGEPSGDRIAAMVSRALGGGVAPWGLTGVAGRRAGIDPIADTTAAGVMGLWDGLGPGPALAAGLVRLARRARRRPPRAALLISYTELNARLGRALRHYGVKVLWCVAPQVWAWRPSRATTLARAMDRLAVLLPFEVSLWHRVGVDTRYVGHPSFELARGAESSTSSAPLRTSVAVLPGSRPREVQRLAAPLIDAGSELIRRGIADEATLLWSPSLPTPLRDRVEARARNAGLSIRVVDGTEGAAPHLHRYAVALAASGTVCLEAALAGAAPVITYRTDALTYAAARRLVRTPHVGLPNVVLGRRAFPELLQDRVEAGRIADAVEHLLSEPAATREAVTELRARLRPPSPLPFGERVAELLRPWL